eukprot:CAMPEP_0172211588 /NCGR_PEP_ID=MMETSP1050-20130122/36493_1 /TAXON_ID=233186 /ORGANISM="Cryptomonas curvata, Strain CCAP979/52" /LENGTH=113 /DNA_ID=CAMNT_0012892071 /DNA_START=160 /DNA_END=498 /DNA_ORIENTATION=-
MAVKLSDCLPKKKPKLGAFSPFVVNGKRVPWSLVKQIIGSNPQLVMSHVEARAKKVTQKLNDLQSQEIIEEEAVDESKRRLSQALSKLKKIDAVHSVHAAHSNDPIQKNYGFL